MLDPAIFGDDSAPKKNLCAVDGCINPRHRADSLCAAHVKRRERGKALDTPLRPRHRKTERPACGVVSCKRPVHAKGLCYPHRKRQLHGKEIRSQVLDRLPREETVQINNFRVRRATRDALRRRAKECGLDVTRLVRRVLDEWAKQFDDDRRSSESRVLDEVER